MSLSAKDLKAINWFTQEHKLRVQLSTPPTMYFRNQEGEMVTHDLSGITLEYKTWNEEDKKQRSQDRKIAATRRIMRSSAPSR